MGVGLGLGLEGVDEGLELHQRAVAPPRPGYLKPQPRAQRLGGDGPRGRRAQDGVGVGRHFLGGGCVVGPLHTDPDAPGQGQGEGLG